MPAPLVLIGGAAAGGAASAIAGFAAQVSLDAMTSYMMAGLDSGGEIATAPQTPIIVEGDTITIHNAPAGANVEQQIDIGPVGGPANYRMGIVHEDSMPDGADGSWREDIHSIEQQDGGRTVLAEMREAVEANPAAEANDTLVTGANDYQQRAATRAARNGVRPNVTTQRQRDVIGNAQVDGSRTSMEYHEYKHNVRISAVGKPISNAQIAFDQLGFYSIEYIGTDPVDTYYPPYFAWVQYEEYRKMINIIKKYRRLRGKCGGKDLWEQQGHASKTAAIADDVENDSEYQTLHGVLDLTSDWQTHV